VSVRSGIAEQASMIRADIFEKRGKFYAVPIYQSDRVSPDLPNRAVVAYKAREEWPIMDESFSFVCSLHPNDLVRLEKKEEEFFGYYAGLDVATGAISILYHDRDATVGKNGLFRGLGIKTSKAIQKFHVDPLGRVYSSRKETRHGLA
jgi:CRISPR-associated endonuclease Csn1